MLLLLKVDFLYSVLLVKNVKNIILRKYQNWHNKLTQDTKVYIGYCYGKEKKVDVVSQRCIRNLLERNLRQN